MPERDGWFVEQVPEADMAMSLKIKRKLHSEQTPFQTIEIYETTAFGNLMVIDGFVMLTTRDNFVYHEMMAHPALFTHSAPRTVAIIGGGDCGTLREVLRHATVQRALQIEIDERVTRLAERFFPELTEANGDSRADLRFDDGIRWMREAVAGSVDVVIVDSTDPVGPAEGLFAEPFYRSCHAALGAGGVFVQQSESPLLHLKLLRAMHAALRAAGFSDVRTIQFPQPTYPSGWWSATLARRGAAVDAFRYEDAAAKVFETRYYSADVHAGALAMPPFFVRAMA